MRIPKWFKEENRSFTWEQVLNEAFPKRLFLRNEKHPKPFLERPCKFPDRTRRGHYKYLRAIVLHDGEEVDIYELERIK